MADEFTRADTVREYLTGASSDGGVQTDPNLSLGDRRSSTEVVSLGITLTDAIPNVVVEFASGANPPGNGSLIVEGTDSLRWMPPGDTAYGPPCVFGVGTTRKVVEANDSPGKYLRVQALTPLNPGLCTVTLSVLRTTVYGFADVSVSEASSGVSHYRATMAKNVGGSLISGFFKYIATLGTSQASDVSVLGGSGAGSIATSGSFVDWPLSGWCQVRTSGGSLKEVVYYSGRTGSTLTVPSGGRSLLGTSSTAGGLTDLVYPVPGIAIGKDPTGVITAGSAIQAIANDHTPPVVVTWNLGITQSGGLSLVDLNPGDQVGVWLWYHIPPGTVSNAGHLKKVWDVYNTF
jgi:hypothetical protein